MALEVPSRDDWFTLRYGLPRPDWQTIAGWIRAFAGEETLELAWQDCTRQWLDRLREALGGDYLVSESENFHFLSADASLAEKRFLPFLEKARRSISGILKDASLSKWHGKHVILRFSELEEYDRYVAHFLPDGEFAGSGGMFLSGGYHHIAYPAVYGQDAEKPTLVHELTHNLFVRLPLPRWLSEALAMAFEKDLTGRSLSLSAELVDRHRAWWNDFRIQEFWNGTSFRTVEGQELSYSLAQILLNLIYADLRPAPLEFRRFVLRACRGDAGVVACREHLGLELGEVAEGFLGPGDWQPKPDRWNAAKR